MRQPNIRPLAGLFAAFLPGLLWAASLHPLESAAQTEQILDPGAEFNCVVMPHAVVDVSSGVNGRIESINVDRGDAVKKGQLLAALESRVEKANAVLARERAAITSEIHLREAALAYDKRNKDRADTLYERKVITPQQKDQVDKDAELAQWRLRQAEDKKRLAGLESRRADELLDLKSVRSPITGVVIERFKSPGEYVEEEPILRIARLDPMRAEVVLPVGMHEALSHDFVAEIIAETEPDRARAATIAVIDPMADPASGTFRVGLELPNPGYKLLGGVKCKARFALRAVEPHEDAEPVEHQADSSLTPMLDFNLPGPYVDPQAGGAVEPRPVDDHGDASLSPTLDPNLPGSYDDAREPPKAAGPVAHNRDSSPDPMLTPGPPGPSASPLASAALEPLEQSTAVSTVATCRSAGPIESLARGQRVANAVAEQTVRSELREARTSTPNGYVVLMAAAGEEDFARLQERLRADGISDFLLLRSGRYQGQISLGTYSSAENAARRSAVLAELGYESGVHERTRTHLAWWLDLDPSASLSSSAEIIELIEALEPGVLVRPTECSSMLTVSNDPPPSS